MKFRMILFTIFAFAMVALVCAADVSGKWTAEVQGRGGNTMTQTFTFKVDGDKLTGTFSGGRGGELQISDGKVKGDEISFTVVRQGQSGEVKINYKGKVSGDEIKFTSQREGGQGQAQEFTAKRAK